MSKDKYLDLVGHPDIRIRVEGVDGNWSREVEIWWGREQISFMTAAGPSVKSIIAAEGEVLDAIRAVNIDPGEQRGVVSMFHGTFVTIKIWCPPGTATRLGIKGYGT